MSGPSGFKEPEVTVVSLEGGKYEFRAYRGTLLALRYGEPWRDFTGDKAVGALVSKIEELEKELAAKRWEGAK